MKSKLNITINFLKDQIKTNLDEIKSNETKLRSILDLKKDSNTNEAVNLIFEQNKQLLMQNFDILNLQLSLLKVINTVDFERKATEKPIVKDSKTVYTDFFKDTIEGKIRFDQSHPLYNDKNFFDKLLNYFLNIENYEMCANLLELKKNNLELQ